jgi:hypothetical protein
MTLSNDAGTTLYITRQRRLPRLLDAFATSLRRALPQTCALCAAAAGDALVCAGCAGDLPRLPAACPICALPSAPATACGACLKRAPPFATTIAPFAYAFPVDRLVQALKYRAQLALGGWLADALVDAVVARGGRDPTSSSRCHWRGRDNGSAASTRPPKSHAMSRAASRYRSAPDSRARATVRRRPHCRGRSA